MSIPKSAIALVISTQICTTASALELGLSTWWLSEGKTEWSHNAQILNPDLGNPTSRLIYDKTRGPIFELTGRHAINSNFDLSGGLLFGSIDDGTNYDEDYYSAAFVRRQGYATNEDFKFLETKSNIVEGNVSGFNVEVGYNFSGMSSPIRLNAGFMNWTELYDAFGVDIVVCRLQACAPVGTTIVPDSIKGLTNETTWNMFYVGGDFNIKASNNTTLKLGLKYMPIGDAENVDTHHLRDDLAKPSVLQEGDGSGYQAEFMVEYRFKPKWAVNAGFRARNFSVGYTENGHTVTGSNGTRTNMDLRDLESTRSGVIIGISYSI